MHTGTQWMPWRQGKGRKGERGTSCIHKRLLTFLSKTKAQQKEPVPGPLLQTLCLGACPSLVSVACHKIQWPKNNLKGKWLHLAHNSRLQSITIGNIQWWELEIAGQITPTDKNREK